MRKNFIELRDKLGLFAAGRLSLRRCHRMLTASIVAYHSLCPWPSLNRLAERIEQARRLPTYVRTHSRFGDACEVGLPPGLLYFLSAGGFNDGQGHNE